MAQHVILNNVRQEVWKTTLDYGKASVKSLSVGQYVLIVRDEAGQLVGQQVILKL